MEDGVTDATAGAEVATEEQAYTPNLEGLKRMVMDWQSLTQEARRESQIDDDYYHNYQLTPDERRVLRKRKQPDSTFNHVRLAVNGTLGVVIQGNTDPQAFPREPKDEAGADVATKTLRYSADEANFDATKVDVAKNYLVEGTGSAIVEVDADARVQVNQIRWEEHVFDPRARRQDFKDGKYEGIAKWQYADDVIRSYPEKKTEIEAALSAGSFLADDVSSDRPDNVPFAWCDRRLRRIMVVELYFRDGDQWMRAVFHSGGVLEAGPSPYLDDKKRPCNPIESQSCYVDRENNRYGIVRDMRSPQDEINKRRQKLLYLVTVRQIQQVAPDAAEVDANEARAEAARPDGVIPAGWQIVPTTDLATGQAQLLAEAKGEIERMGPNPAVLGRSGENQSGRANLVRQQAGMTEQAVILVGIDEWELRIYRQIWWRQRQFWTPPMWIRVTGDNDKPDFLGINQPITDEFGNVLGYENSFGELDIDIILDRTPDTANLQQEQFAMMVELAKVGALGNPQQAGQLLLRASSLPEKQKVIEGLNAPQEPSPEQRMAQEIQVRGAMAKIAKDEASAEQARTAATKNLADAGKSQATAQSTEAATTIKVAEAAAAAALIDPMLGVPTPVGVPVPAAGAYPGAPPFAGA